MFIHIAPDLNVAISPESPNSGVAVPVLDDYRTPPLLTDGTPTHAFGDVVAVALSELASEEAGRVEAAVGPLDPWLLAVAALMWDGIVQGFAWDAAKLVVAKALAVMQREAVAPPDPATRVTSRGLRVRWSGCMEAGVLFKLFTKLSVKYEAMSELEVDRLPRPNPKGPRARRPLNECADCGYTWFPRGHDWSPRCPECGTPR